MIKSFLTAGGDLRFVTLAEKLSDGNKVFALGFDKNIISSKRIIVADSFVRLQERVDYIILPLPASNDGINVNTPYSGQNIPLSSLKSVIKEDGIIFGGRVTDEIKNIFSPVPVIDYSEREEFAVMNSIATAEGAIQVAMEETATTISGQNILILGMGRIAKTLIRTFSGFGAKITAAARRCESLAWAGVFGCDSLRMEEIYDSLDKFGIIFNTVPAMVLDERHLRKIKPESLIIDLASKPGGVDFEMAGKLGLRAVWSLSLPGKVAPVTSGEVIAKTIDNILKEERGEDDNG